MGAEKGGAKTVPKKEQINSERADGALVQRKKLGQGEVWREGGTSARAAAAGMRRAGGRALGRHEQGTSASKVGGAVARPRHGSPRIKAGTAGPWGPAALLWNASTGSREGAGALAVQARPPPNGCSTFLVLLEGAVVQLREQGAGRVKGWRWAAHGHQRQRECRWGAPRAPRPACSNGRPAMQGCYTRAPGKQSSLLKMKKKEPHLQVVLGGGAPAPVHAHHPLRQLLPPLPLAKPAAQRPARARGAAGRGSGAASACACPRHSASAARAHPSQMCYPGHAHPPAPAPTC